MFSLRALAICFGEYTFSTQAYTSTFSYISGKKQYSEAERTLFQRTACHRNRARSHPYWETGKLDLLSACRCV